MPRCPASMLALVLAPLLGLAASLALAADAAPVPTAPVAALAKAPPLLDPALDEPRFESVGVGAIPQAVVSALAQDRAGFLWIGTPAGLVRYDGYNFRQQRREGRVAAAQSFGFVRTLLPGRDGRLWIGTESDGLASYDPADDRVVHYRQDGGGAAAGASAPAATVNKGPAPTIRALVEDHDGALWIGSVGGGVERFDPKSGRFMSYRHDGTKAGTLPDDRVQALLIDRSGTLWVGSWAGLARLKPGSTSFDPVFSDAGAPGLAGKIVVKLFETADGRIWAGSQQGDLAVVDPATGAGRLLDAAPGAGTAAHGGVLSLLQVPDGTVWVGRAGGIELRAPEDGQLLRLLRHDPAKPNGLAGNEVRALLLDRAGWVWVGGYGVGLQRHDPANRSIRVRGADARSDSPLAEPNVRSVLALDNGEIWLGTNSAGVAVVDAGLRVIGAIRPADAGGRRGSQRISAMVQMADGSVWLGAEAGLYQYSRERRLLRHLATGAGQTRRLLASVDGWLWIGTQDGLYLLRPGATALLRLTQVDGAPLGGDINAIAEAPSDGGALWIGTEKGLYRIDGGERGGAALLRHVPFDDDANPSVVGLLVDSSGRLWVDTAVGGLLRLERWDGRTARFERVSERHGGVGRAFGANLMEDRRGRIWTHQFIYDPATSHYDELTAADGVDFGTGWFRSYAKTRDGRMLFGGSKGVLVVQPDGFEGWNYLPPLVVSQLRVDGRALPPGLAKQGLTLAPGQRGFSVEFSALDYSEPARNRYAYRLDGFDADWIWTGADVRLASYGNLSPGRYTLYVRASNRAGLWTDPPMAIAVEVQPAWWQRDLFRALTVLVGAALVWLVFRLRLRVLEGRQRGLEEKVNERTAELQALSQELRRKSAALEEASLTDPLTGLRNRRFLSQHIESDISLTLRRCEDALQRGVAPPDDADLIFFLVDIDHFKSVNDEHGHAAGDAVLVQMRERLEPVFREADYLMRWGGEEFLIVARASSRRHAPELAERARAAVSEQPFRLPDGATIVRSCSVGFACYPLVRERPRALEWGAVIGLADGALYAVKRAGRNGWLGVLGVDGEVPSADALRQPRQMLEQSLAGEGPLLIARGDAALEDDCRSVNRS